MAVLGQILMFVLLFEGISGGSLFLYFRPGQDAMLPCNRVSPEEKQCSHISWYHDSVEPKTVFEVKQGKVSQNSARAARLRLDTGCSLIINNITAEDVGRYGCRSGNAADDSLVFLSVLIISSSAADADAQTDDRITLTCSLLRYMQLPLCPENSLQWVNETGAVLSGEGVGYELNGQKDCGSSLTVTPQSGQNRRYICRFVERGSVKIDAEYTAVSTVPHQSETFIIVGAVGGALLVVLVIITAVLKYRKRAKTPTTDDAQKQSHHVEEPEGGLTYVTVDHNDKNTSPKKKVEEEERVTYSTLRAPGKAEADDDPGNVYSFVR